MSTDFCILCIKCGDKHVNLVVPMEHVLAERATLELPILNGLPLFDQYRVEISLDEKTVGNLINSLSTTFSASVNKNSQEGGKYKVLAQGKNWITIGMSNVELGYGVSNRRYRLEE